MSKKKFSITELFYNDRFVLLFSIFVAIVLWFIMATTNTIERPREIDDVPIVVNLSEVAKNQGLKVFDQSSTKAKVWIKGNSMIVNQISAADLQVTTQLSADISKPNSYPLSLSVQKVSKLADFEIVKVEPSSIIANVDVYKEVSFKIEDNIKYKADPGYFVSTPSFSTDSITISGPAGEISKVAKVSVDYDINNTLTETKNFTADLTLYNSYGEKIKGDKLTLSTDKVDVTIAVLSRQVTPVNVTFANKPIGLNFMSNQMTVDPISLEIAAPEDVLTNFKEIKLEPIDFAKVSPTKNEFSVNITLPPGCKNLSNIYTADVKFNLSGFTTRTMTAKNFKVNNLSASKTSEVFTKSLDVTVVGPETQVSKLTNDDLTAQIDMSGKEYFTGHTEMPVNILIRGAPSCWIFGTYNANVSVLEKITD